MTLSQELRAVQIHSMVQKVSKTKKEKPFSFDKSKVASDQRLFLMQLEDFSQENFEEVTKQFDKVFSQNLERDPEFKISTFVMSMNKLGYLPLSKMIPAQYLLNRESGLNSLYEMTMKLGIKSIQLMEILI